MKRGDTDALYAFLDSTGGMDKFTAKALATTTFICQTSMRASTREHARKIATLHGKLPAS